MEGEIRLTNGTFEFEGRVDICLNGVWGTVCGPNYDSHHQFDDINTRYDIMSERLFAEVVCRQLVAQLDITSFRCEYVYVYNYYTDLRRTCRVIPPCKHSV